MLKWPASNWNMFDQVVVDIEQRVTGICYQCGAELRLGFDASTLTEQLYER